jgi:tetratricopeptide (TPR) repeat protein
MSRSEWRRVARVPAALALLAIVLITAFKLWPGRSADKPGSPGDHLRQARAALDAADPDLARRHLEEVTAILPLHVEARFLLARASRRAGDYAAWETHLREAEILGWPTGQIDLESHLRQAQSGDIWSIERPLLLYLDQLPQEEVLILEALVKGYLENKRLDDILRLTDVWARRRPDDWQARLYRGRALQFVPNREEAAAEYRWVLDRRPDQPQARLWLAQILLLDSHYKEALAEFETYHAAHPGDPEGLFGVANSQFSLGRVAEARAALDRLHERRSDHLLGLLTRAKVELSEGLPEEALTWLKRAERVAPKETDVVYNLSVVLRQLRRPAEAEAYSARLKDLTAQYEQLDDLVKRIRESPNDVGLRFETAALALDLGREGDAAQWFKSVLWLDPDHRPTHARLAEYYKQKGDAKRAAAHVRRAGVGE